MYGADTFRITNNVLVCRLNQTNKLATFLFKGIPLLDYIRPLLLCYNSIVFPVICNTIAGISFLIINNTTYNSL